MISGTRIEVPEELFVVAESSSFSGSSDLAILKTGPDLYEFIGPLDWQVLIANTGEDALLVSGTVEGRARTSCVRCLEPFEMNVLGEIEGCYLLDDPGENVPDDLAEDEYAILGQDRIIDMEPLIEAALRLALPLVPLCREDCKGLCSKCGKNLNEGPCECSSDEEDADWEASSNPFAALKDLHLEN